MCTGIRLKAEDGTAVHARTLEFGIDIESDVIVIPKGYQRQERKFTIIQKKTSDSEGSPEETTPEQETIVEVPAKTWSAQYASVGMSALKQDIIIDGVNEVGLAIGLFYFPGFAEYQHYSESDNGNIIGSWELGSYILENYASTDEVKTGLSSIVVPGAILKEFNEHAAPPVHFVVREQSGKSIVIEYVGGELKIHDNPLGVITNSPTFDWHITNLRNYIYFSLTNVPSRTLGSKEEGLGEEILSQLGQGSGMVGIPGDFTPPSRFVRAVAYSQAVSNDSPFRAKTGEEAVLQAFHLLNNFDIPDGVARDESDESHGHGHQDADDPIADYTLWTSAINLKEQKYYFRTYDNSQIRVVDLHEQGADFSTKITRIPIDGKEAIQPISWVKEK